MIGKRTGGPELELDAGPELELDAGPEPELDAGPVCSGLASLLHTLSMVWYPGSRSDGRSAGGRRAAPSRRAEPENSSAGREVGWEGARN